jgi:hypothetical protein
MLCNKPFDWVLGNMTWLVELGFGFWFLVNWVFLVAVCCGWLWFVRFCCVVLGLCSVAFSSILLFMV